MKNEKQKHERFKHPVQDIGTGYPYGCYAGVYGDQFPVQYDAPEGSGGRDS
jgi:hypothetical protein